MQTPLEPPALIVEPQADALLRRLAPLIDDAMLCEIAAADYDRDTDVHLRHLKALRDGLIIPVPIAFEPKEVLELMRWSEPEADDWYPGGSGTRGHRMRLFACAALLRIAQEPGNIGVLDGQNYTVIQMLESVEALGAGLERDAGALLSWSISQLYPHSAHHADDLAFMALALLRLALAMEPRPVPADLIQWCVWLTRCEELARQQSLYPERGGRWLLSTTSNTLRHEKWEKLGASLRVLASREAHQDLRSWLELIGGLLEGRPHA